MSIEHKDITGANMHPPYNWSFTNATTRGAAGSYVLGDIGKWAYQQSDSTIWQLASFDGGGVPTWTQVAGSGGMTNPMTTLDDIIIGGSSGTPARLAAGAIGSVLAPDPVSGHVGYQTALWLPQGTYLRGYTFDSTVEGWTGEGTVSQSGGQLQMVATSTNQSAVEPSSPTGGTVQHGEVRADFNCSVAGGIIFRYQDVNNYYLIDLNQLGTTTIYIKSGGSFTSLTTLSNPGTGWHRILVRFVGAQIWVFINDSFMGGINNSTISAAGRVGAFVGVNAGVMKLDAMRVYSLSSSWAPSGL